MLQQQLRHCKPLCTIAQVAMRVKPCLMHCVAYGTQGVEYCKSPTPQGTCCGDCKPCNPPAEMQPERDRP